MPKSYNSKYFFSRIQKLREQISRLKGYKTIDELLAAHLKTLDLANTGHNQGNEK